MKMMTWIRSILKRTRHQRLPGLPYSGGLSDLVESVGCVAPTIDAEQYGFSYPRFEHGRVSRLPGGNVIFYCGFASRLPKGSIRIDAGASRNLVIIGENSNPPSGIHFQGSGNFCVIGEQIQWPNLIDVRFSSDEGTLLWGRGATSNGTEVIFEGKGRSVIVGDDCMFARGTSVRTSDLHAIYDASDKLLNPQADVTIAEHCWIGLDAIISKGVHVGRGSIIGARAVVTRSVADRDLVTGIPAKPVRHQVRWERHRPGEGGQ